MTMIATPPKKKKKKKLIPGEYTILQKKNYILEKIHFNPQTTTLSLDGPSNYQGLHFDLPNYQNL